MWLHKNVSLHSIINPINISKKSSYAKNKSHSYDCGIINKHINEHNRHCARVTPLLYRVENGGIRIGISFFVFLIWLPISFYMFIYPYQILMGSEGSPIVFYVLSFITTIWFFIWSIANFADANGFVMVAQNFAADRGAAGFFGIVVAVMMMLISFLAIINAFLFYRRH
jgi:hypothetical protein